LPEAGAVSAPRYGLRRRSCRVEEQGVGTGGFPGNLGDPGSSPGVFRRQWGTGLRTPGPRSRVLGRKGAKQQAQRLVAPREGNEVRCEGRRKSHSLIVPLSGGTCTAGTPWREGGCPSGTRERATRRGLGLRSRVNARLTDSKADSEALAGRTGCPSWARPDLWEPWEATPRATRPIPMGAFFLFPPAWSATLARAPVDAATKKSMPPPRKGAQLVPSRPGRAGSE
jgi:hypothetical protein